MSARALWALALAGCAGAGAAGPGSSPGSSPASRGLHGAALIELAERQWARRLADDPLDATELGVHEFDDRLPDRSPEAEARAAAWRRQLQGELAALRPTLTSTGDRAYAELLAGVLDAEVAGEVCRFSEWSLSAADNPITRYNYLPELHRVDSRADGDALLARYRAIAPALEQEVANLRRGLAAGRVVNAETLRRVSEMVKAQLAAPLERWPLMAPAAVRHPGWSAQEDARWAAALRAEVEQTIAPALARYGAFLVDELAPKARPPDKSGVGALPDGEACYRAQILRHTGLPLSAAEVHARGLAEIARLDRQIAEAGARALGAADLPSTLARLRGDPALYFADAAEIEAKAEAVLRRAEAAVPRFFGLTPRTACVVTRIPDYEAPYSTVAYYRPPVPDGSRPGQYFVNVYEPRTRPRYEAAVLAVHESVPGHHLQIAISQERPDLPALRKHLEASAFVEGWALYSERLAEDMGVYQDELDRLGMLSFDAWRASRLVVDTGLHAMGWSREQAVAFMLAHTALAENNVRNEVDRYISWPGQALAYKVGQQEILRLRAEAEAALGARFSLPAFHDVVLGQGTVTLPLLARNVEAWVAGATSAR